MPRKTPVKELLKEEVTPSSSLRRSSRLSSPVPTKVITRRSSATEAPVSTPKVTRSRRSSYSLETETDEIVKNKPTSAIRTRRGSLTQNTDDDVKEKVTLPRTRTRGSSVPKEPAIEVRKSTRSGRSISEDPIIQEESVKVSTRSRTTSTAKKSESEDTNSSNKNVQLSTPIKKTSPIIDNHGSGSLKPIEEINKENESPTQSPNKNLKRRNTEISKVDFDLSVINETSLTEEEITSPKKSKTETNVEEATEEEEVEKTNSTQPVSGAEEQNATPAEEITPEAPKAESLVVKEDLAIEQNIDCEKLNSTASDTSFNLQLSISGVETPDKVSSHKETDNPAKETECEPMEVDQTMTELSSPNKTNPQKSPDAKKSEEVENKLNLAEKMTDEIAQHLSKELKKSPEKVPKENKKDIQIHNVVVLLDSQIVEKTLSGTTPKKRTSGDIPDNAAEEPKLTNGVHHKATDEEEKNVQELQKISPRKKTPSRQSPRKSVSKEENPGGDDVRRTLMESFVDSVQTSKKDESIQDSPSKVNQSKNAIGESPDSTFTLDVEEDSDGEGFVEEPAQRSKEKIIAEDELFDTVSVSSTEKAEEKTAVPDENKMSVITIEDNGSSDYLDMEVKKINESKDMTIENRVAEENVQDVSDSESEEDVPISTARSPVKKRKNFDSVSDDEVFVKSDKMMGKKNLCVLNRSIDSKYALPVRGKQRSPEKNNVVELSDTEKDDSVFIVQDKNSKNDNIKEVSAEQSILETSTRGSTRKRSLDKTAITLQETMKSGENPEEALSGRIHRVVDLFCAGIKYKSDVSINVSLEYTGQFSDSEGENDKTEVVEISLSASDVGKVDLEPQRGSKRRKIILTSKDVLSPNKSQSEGEIESDEPVSPNKSKRHDTSSLSAEDSPKKVQRVLSEGKKVSPKLSPQKSKKRLSNNGTEFNASTCDTSLQISVCDDGERKVSSAKKRKSRHSGVFEEYTKEDKVKLSPIKSPVKKVSTATPTKVSPQKSNITDEESSDDEEENEESVISQNEDSIHVLDILSRTLEDSDVNDTTWVPSADSETNDLDSDGSLSDEEVEELSSPEEEIVEVKPSASNLKDEVIVQRKNESPSKTKSRKLFRLSKFNVSQALGSSDSMENVEQPKGKSTPKSKHTEDKKAQNSKKSSTLYVENVENIKPQVSEVSKKKGKNKNRQDLAPMKSVDEIKLSEKSIPKFKKNLKSEKHTQLVEIKPSGGKMKNSKVLNIKPSTETNSGWDVSTL